MRLGLLFNTLALAVAVSACHSSNTTPTDATTTTTTTDAATTVSVAIDGQTPLTGLRQRSQLLATAAMSDGTTTDVTKTATWASTNPKVATVSAAGVVTTVSEGSATLTANYSGVFGGIDLRVSVVTTTFSGTVTASDGQTGTFTLTVSGAIAPAPMSTTALVSGTIQLRSGATIAVTGVYQALTGAVTLSGVDAVFSFSGAAADASLNGAYTGANGVTGTLVSQRATVN